ncbi:hypothetical protein [Salinigranum sp. GCM10025319]|uniref:hypothetical protein n=1 Tax=Salinigranum sp. GCM10025319 TaxID=3252687 RepID=UPI0036128187
MDDGDRTARRDAALTLLVLAPVTVVGIALGAPLAPAAVALGAGGTVVLELLLLRQKARVRAVWADRRVQVAAVAVAVGGGVALAAVAGPWVLTAIGAGLCTYLLLLAGSVVWQRSSPRREGNA